MSSLRYDGVWPLRAVYVRRRTFNSIQGANEEMLKLKKYDLSGPSELWLQHFASAGGFSENCWDSKRWVALNIYLSIYYLCFVYDSGIIIFTFCFIDELLYHGSVVITYSHSPWFGSENAILLVDGGVSVSGDAAAASHYFLYISVWRNICSLYPDVVS